MDNQFIEILYKDFLWYGINLATSSVYTYGDINQDEFVLYDTPGFGMSVEEYLKIKGRQWHTQKD